MTPEALRSRFALSEEEWRALAAFDEAFVRTAAHTNLVARSTLPDRWLRHYADSLQLWPLLPEGARTVLDVGAGGGFPGIPLAILARARRPDMKLTLADSVGKKARFLGQVIDELGLRNAVATDARVEALPYAFDVVTARAVASLPKLLDLAVPRLAPGGTLILPKGARAAEELADARSSWRFDAKRVDSATDERASILVITKPERLR